MKQRIGIYNKKIVVSGDENLVSPNEIHINDLYSDDKNDISKKQRIGVYKSKVVIAGDINLVGPNEIHISKIGESDGNSEKPEDTPITPREITFNAWVIVSSGDGVAGGEYLHESQTFTALDGMTWKEYIDSGYGLNSPFFYYEGGGVYISDGSMWFPQEYGIFLDGILVSENDKIIANAQYDNYPHMNEG